MKMLPANGSVCSGTCTFVGTINGNIKKFKRIDLVTISIRHINASILPLNLGGIITFS